MKEVASNNYYELNVNKSKNRLYLKVKGFWPNAEAVSDYISDIEKSGKSLKKGFTVVADLREMKSPPVEVNAIHEKAQKLLIQMGLTKTAEIHQEAIIKSIAKKISDASSMNKNIFSALEEAEKWLDS